jgi:hydroxymethylpyrimidine pyrophosphatase-like HAD family hydrolase
MFEASDVKIAVSNAFPELKEKADIIAGSNREDGVALWLKRNYPI